MKNLKSEMILLIVAWILTIINLIVDFIHGLSRAQIFNDSCSAILILLWSISFIIRKRGQ